MRPGDYQPALLSVAGLQREWVNEGNIGSHKPGDQNESAGSTFPDEFRAHLCLPA